MEEKNGDEIDDADDVRMSNCQTNGDCDTIVLRIVLTEKISTLMQNGPAQLRFISQRRKNAPVLNIAATERLVGWIAHKVFRLGQNRLIEKLPDHRLQSAWLANLVDETVDPCTLFLAVKIKAIDVQRFREVIQGAIRPPRAID